MENLLTYEENSAWLDFSIAQLNMSNFYSDIDREVSKIFKNNRRAVMALVIEDRASW